MMRIMPLIIALTLMINSPCTLLFAVSDDSYVVSHEGDVRVIRAGTNIGIPCYKDMVIQTGDYIHTGSGARAVVGHLGSTSFVTEVSENSLIEILDGSPYWIDLSDGKLLTKLQGVEEGKTFMVRTPVGACGARGTGWELSTNGINDQVKVFESKVFYQWLDPYGDMADIDEAVWINEGFKRDITKYEKPGEMQPVSTDEIDELTADGNKLAIYGKLRREVVERKGVGVNKDGYR